MLPRFDREERLQVVCGAVRGIYFCRGDRNSRGFVPDPDKRPPGERQKMDATEFAKHCGLSSMRELMSTLLVVSDDDQGGSARTQKFSDWVERVTSTSAWLHDRQDCAEELSDETLDDNDMEDDAQMLMGIAQSRKQEGDHGESGGENRNSDEDARCCMQAAMSILACSTRRWQASVWTR